MVSDVTTSGIANDAANTLNQGLQLAEDFNEFLTLLTTQLQNQDPLSPMDSTEFTNQLVQFSQVEQAINQNQKLDDMLALQLANLSTIGLSYVGMDVSYLSIEANFDGEAPVTINYSLNEEVVSAQVNIYDEGGDLIYSAEAPTATGQNEIIWDGTNTGGTTLEEGTYRVSIDALDSEGQSVDVSTAVSGRVRGIETQDGVVFLLVGDRAVPISSVLQARVPAEVVTDTGTEGTDTEGDTDA